MAVFGKKQKDLMDSHISTIISDGCKIDGNISSKSSVRIDGIVNGNASIQQGLIIGTTGKIHGDIQAEEAVVFGTIKGNITVKKLEIKNTGVITGEISTQTIEIEFGAVYNGKVTMKSPGEHAGVSSKQEFSNGVMQES